MLVMTFSKQKNQTNKHEKSIRYEQYREWEREHDLTRHEQTSEKNNIDYVVYKLQLIIVAIIITIIVVSVIAITIVTVVLCGYYEH